MDEALLKYQNGELVEKYNIPKSTLRHLKALNLKKLKFGRPNDRRYRMDI